MMRTIYGVGVSQHGAFIDFNGQPSAVVVSPSDGAVTIVAEISEGRLFQGVLPGEALIGLALRPATEVGGGWIVVVHWRETSGKKRGMPLGVWNRSYADIDTWVLQVNQMIAATRATDNRPGATPSISPIADRIAKRGRVIAAYGVSLTSSEIRRFAPYKKAWMEEAARNVATIIAARMRLSSPPSVTMQDWPTGETWDTVFDRMRIREVNEMETRHPIDICFETLYQSDFRKTKFGIIDLGKLRSGRILYHENNTAIHSVFDRLTDEALKKDADKAEAATPANLFYRTFELIRSVHETQKHSHQTMIVAVGTMAEDISNHLIALDRWGPHYRQQVSKSVDIVEALKHHQADRFVYCDNVIANDLIARWRDDTMGGDLHAQPFAYMKPIPLGIAYDAQDAEWGGILREAIDRSRMSSSKGVQQSWKETLNDLQSIDVDVEVSVDHELEAT